jgi:hypothetical protein
MRRDSLVGIATRYGLGGPGIESMWGARFSASIQTGSEAHPASYTVSTGSFPGIKRPGHGVQHLPLSSAEVKERVELYLYSPSGPLWPVLGWVIGLYIYSVCVCVCVSLCPRQGPEVFLYSRMSRLAVGPYPASFSMDIWDLFPLGVKRPGREADHFSLVPSWGMSTAMQVSVLVLIMYAFIAYTGTASGIQSRTEFVVLNPVPSQLYNPLKPSNTWFNIRKFLHCIQMQLCVLSWCQDMDYFPIQH